MLKSINNSRNDKWDTSCVINSKNIFNGCQSLISLPDISKWKLKNDIIKDIFPFGCSSLSFSFNGSVWKNISNEQKNDSDNINLII
jgi:surface protein